jgi:hypothetical protein
MIKLTDEQFREIDNIFDVQGIGMPENLIKATANMAFELLTEEQIKHLAESKGMYSGDELKAHCGKLFGLVNDLDSYLDTNEFTSISHGSIFHQQMKHLITFAPQQSLNEIKAQAIDEAIDEIGFIECAGKIPAIDLFDLREYVSQLREQGDRE